MVAVMKLARVPASIARMPRRARSWRRVGASAPMPPIWMPIELKLAKPHNANVAIVKERGSSAGLHRAELRVGDELVERHARAEQVPDRRRITPGDAHAPRNGCEDPSENLLQAQADDTEERVDERDEGKKRDEHRAHVQRELRALRLCLDRRRR